MLNPMTALRDQWRQALEQGEAAARHCALATIGEDGRPAVRMLNIEAVTEDSILLFTSATSPKWRQLRQRHAFEILIFWPTLLHQYRLGGNEIREMERDVMERRWREKSYDAKILDIFYSEQGQSSVISSRRDLRERIDALKTSYPSEESLPFPDHMKGLYFSINYLEHWIVSTEDRLHERLRYHLNHGKWEMETLVP